MTTRKWSKSRTRRTRRRQYRRRRPMMGGEEEDMKVAKATPEAVATNAITTGTEAAEAAEAVAANPVEAKKIHTFMRNPKVTEGITSRFLKNICSDSNVCIAFGVEQPKIYKFFHGYTDKRYMQLPIHPIGKKSRNGFANEIEYMRDGYVSHAVLKSSLRRGADNLMYEYIVGQYMNKMAKFYPCIMQTYSLIQYGDADSYHMMQTSVDSITTRDELEMVKLNPVHTDSIVSEDLLLDACQNPLKYAVLTQSIKNAPDFDTIRRAGDLPATILSLHQIYFTLHCLRMSFTHYDLHMENVLCYNVGQNKYIEFMYHLNDGTTLQYNYDKLSYMLDYGRCFFYESPENNSAEIFDKLCKVPCPTPCGAGDGFKNLFGNESVYIVGHKRNMSADLRLLKLGFRPDPSSRAKSKFFTQTKFDGQYSTPEVVESGFDAGKIHNVSDAFRALSKYIRAANKELTDSYMRRGYTKMGTLHIYEDGITPMKYEPVPKPKFVPPPMPPPPIFIRPPSSSPIPIPTATSKVDTRVSTAVSNAPYITDYINFSPPKSILRPPLPPPTLARRLTAQPTNTIRARPLVLPPEIDKAFYERETPPLP